MTAYLGNCNILLYIIYYNICINENKKKKNLREQNKNNNKST